MDMTAEAITKIEALAAPTTFRALDVHGIETTFSSKPLHQVKAAPPEEAPVVPVSTLAGFADLIKANLEGQDFPGEFLIHVQDEHTVVLKARVCDPFGRRLELIRAQPVEFRKFQFGQWHDQESFAIAMMSLFADSPDRNYVLQMASALTNESTSLSEDDGVSQKATIKAGLRTKENVTLRPRVDLAPYRTFPEVEQPISQFIFRARMSGDTPALMLVEADGGRWKVDAISTISQAMAAFDLNIPIIA